MISLPFVSLCRARWPRCKLVYVCNMGVVSNRVYYPRRSCHRQDRRGNTTALASIAARSLAHYGRAMEHVCSRRLDCNEGSSGVLHELTCRIVTRRFMSLFRCSSRPPEMAAKEPKTGRTRKSGCVTSRDCSTASIMRQDCFARRSTIAGRIPRGAL